MSLTEMEGRNRVDFWEKDNECLVLNFQSEVPMLMESLALCIQSYEAG